jgi:tetratricopeptide (TPR) repeat protein
LEPAYLRYSNLGVVFQQEGKYPEAVSMYQRAIDMNPSSYLAWGNLASAYLHSEGAKAKKTREAYLKAIAVAEESRKRSPNDARLLADIGAYYAIVEMPEKGLPLLRQAVALAPKDPQIVFRMADAQEILHHREEALRWIGQALALGYSLATIEHDPAYAGLLADPRFPRAAAKVR